MTKRDRRTGRRDAAAAAAEAELPLPRTRLEKALLVGVQACLAAVLAMPLVVFVDLAYGTTTGKLLYAYPLIEAALVLWTALVLANPAFLPPRSKLLALLAAGVAWSVVAAAFGSGWERSLWSTYSRMHGLVGAAHWFAFAVLLAATYRSLAQLRALFSIHLGVSVVVAALAALSYFELPMPIYGHLPERDPPRIGATLGNAIALGVYAVLSTVLALALLVADLRSETAKGASPRRIALLVLWGVAAAANVWVFTLAGSLTATLAAAGGAVAYGVAPAWRGRGWRRGTALAVLAVATTAAAAIVGAYLFVEPAPKGTYEHPLARRIAEVGIGSEGALDRWFAWQAGWAGFLEKPLFGWGPEHYIVAFGRYASAEAPIMLGVHADAHNAFLDKLATEGLPGLALLVALWGFLAVVAWRAAARAPPRQGALALGIGTALACYLVQCQTANWNANSHMVFLLALAGAVQLETATAPGAPGRFGRLVHLRPVRAALAIGAAALVAGGLAAGHGIYRGAAAFVATAVVAVDPFGPRVAPAERAARTLIALDYHREAIDAFGPLANLPRRFLLDHLEVNWSTLRVPRAEAAKRWLAYAEAEAAKAMAAEPQNWLLHHSLARLYLRVSTTDPKYEALAHRHYQRSTALAPHMPIYKPPPK